MSSHLFGHIGAGDSHSNTDIRFLQSGGVVDAVPGHGHDGAEALAALHYDQLLLGRRAGEHDLRVESISEINYNFLGLLQRLYSLFIIMTAVKICSL